MPCNSDFLHKLYFSSVPERLQIAHALYGRFHDVLQADTTLTGELQLLQAKAEELSAHMSRMDMGRLCVHCAAKEGGGCCSLFMAGETDAVQLLMNLLLGIDVKEVRDDGIECCFLGQAGCLFIVKPMFCLNYNCSQINENSSKEMLKQLEMLSGNLLCQQYSVEQIILGIICGS